MACAPRGTPAALPPSGRNFAWQAASAWQAAQPAKVRATVRSVALSVTACGYTERYFVRYPLPAACAAGRFSNATGLSAAMQCSLCPMGSACSSGSVAPDPCSPGTVAPTFGASACDLCAGGTYQSSPDASACDLCEGGSYCPVGASAALPCKEGSFSSATNLASAAQCTPTYPGFFAVTGSVKQTACAAGTIAPTSGLGECLVCNAGTWQDETAATVCKLCERGSFCREGAAAPLPCPGGFYSNATNLASAAQCTVADPGHFSPTASAEQRRCRADTYNPDAAQSSDISCLSCPPDSTTNGKDGQTQISDCVCKPSFYEANVTSKWDTGTVDCQPCQDLHETRTIEMTNCTAAGVTLQVVPVHEGYWRQGPASTIVRACDDEAFCEGGDEPGDASCAPGHVGPCKARTRPPATPPPRSLASPPSLESFSRRHVFAGACTPSPTTCGK
eukprot:241457-Prymnesium_polylepis.1